MTRSGVVGLIQAKLAFLRELVSKHPSRERQDRLDRIADEQVVSVLKRVPGHFAGVYPTRLTDSTGGTTGSALASTAPQSVIGFGAQLLDFVNSGAWTLGVPFAFVINSALWRTGKPASTSAKAATLTLSTSTGAVTGGVISLTTANQNTTGGTAAATAISGAGATVAAGGTLIATASSVTAFVEGDGWLEATVTDTDMANALASLNAMINAIISDIK